MPDRFRFALMLAGLLTVIPVAHAVQPDEVLTDAALEHRARHLSSQLRCMVCQNQSIEDSDAELARDLRLLVRERLTAGDNDQQILDYLVARYGEFVLLKPAFSLRNAILWAAPLVALGGGAFALFLGSRRRRVEVPPPPLSKTEATKVDAILRGREDRAT
jgi:cytochrome c-type biogenesis protein CcmH